MVLLASEEVVDSIGGGDGYLLLFDQSELV